MTDRLSDANEHVQAEADTHFPTVDFSDAELERAANSYEQAVTWQGCTWNFPCKF